MHIWCGLVTIDNQKRSLEIFVTDFFHNKNAFQYDAYRPIVDRIPESAASGVGTGVYLPGPGGGRAWSGTPPPVNRMNDRQV